jgi:glycine/sarcosine/betaine reductase complex component C subunit beta
LTVVVKGVACVLFHTPGLVVHGSKPSRELAASGAESPLSENIRQHLRSYERAVAYPPNQAFIGNLRPQALFDLPRPWWDRTGDVVSNRGPFGEIVSEDDFWDLLREADAFGLVMDSARSGSVPLQERDGNLVGYVSQGYAGDLSQSANILLENLAAKATGAAALRHLMQQTGTEPEQVQYLLGCGEEAVGDRYQRGGGSLSKAMAEMAGLVNADGSDVKAFCCAPVHATVMAGALIQAGVYDHVVVVGGGSLAKLGMKFQGALAHDMPILEDTLASLAILLGSDGGGGQPRLRLDVVGKHDVGVGGAPRALYEALVLAPLRKAGLAIPDVDRYAVELHNPEITEAGGSGNVARTNYRTIASLAVVHAQLAREDVDGFERKHGMPGYVPTQGHIPAALPYLAHAAAEMQSGGMQRAMFVAKGSLFLGKMTNLADGMSFLVEAAR